MKINYMAITLTPDESQESAIAVITIEAGSSFKPKPVLTDLCGLNEDDCITSVVRAYAPDVIGIDCPLGYPRGMDCLDEAHECKTEWPFKGRWGEQQLLELGIDLSRTSKLSTNKEMIQRGIALKTRWEHIGAKVVEVSPHVTRCFIGSSNTTIKETTNAGLAYGFGLCTMAVKMTDDQLRLIANDYRYQDAILGAWTIWQYNIFRGGSVGLEDESLITLPYPISRIAR
tara:strand:- start:603 stop:1289 length:687 start_codon:yes stop_codon:yes gene_type:complete